MTETQLLMRYITWLCCLSLLLGCQKASVTKAPESQVGEINRPATNVGRIEACGLLTKEEVGSTQSAKINDARGSESVSGGLSVSQCFYSASEPDKSVSLTVTQNNSEHAAGDSVGNYWQQTFGRFRNGKEDEETEAHEAEEKEAKGREEDERETPPRKIDQLGDEAYWSGNRFGGAIYVIKRDVILRLSVGGPGDQAEKLERSKALATKALSRF